MQNNKTNLMVPNWFTQQLSRKPVCSGITGAGPIPFSATLFLRLPIAKYVHSNVRKSSQQPVDRTAIATDSVIRSNRVQNCVGLSLLRRFSVSSNHPTDRIPPAVSRANVMPIRRRGLYHPD